MSNGKNSDGGSDNDTHHLIQINNPPGSLVALREELSFHPDVTDAAQHGRDFEDCVGIIAMKLDIALDGVYDVDVLCVLLVSALRSKRFGMSMKDSGVMKTFSLLDVELVEKEGSITLQKRDDNVKTIIPDDAVITETNTNGRSNNGSANRNSNTRDKAGKFTKKN